ncbi:unnamed protein product [Ceutorhynchus assimilis]|uniref:DDB1- and CUL4-associated factor 6 n=1 Tax=Ceutorhynchus assimilis TaxID=467358 RepID=A0A9N9N0H3_9CUCU|nr:unnamed protein product [Ceutorhynchus assimilis]
MAHRRGSIFRDLWDRQYSSDARSISTTAKDDLSMVQRLGVIKSLPVHRGCVNTICWNDRGNLLLSGSDDQHLVITNGFNYKVEENYCTSHKANIFSAKFLPYTNDTQIVSCSGDGLVLHSDLHYEHETYHNQFHCHGGTTTYEIVTVPDSPHSFMSCGEDGTVRWFDLREKSSCSQHKCKDNVIVSCQRAITSLVINPRATHQLAAGCADTTVRIYDRRFLSVTPGEHLLAQPFCTFAAPKIGDERYYRITSLSYDRDGKEMLVSYSSDYLYLFNLKESNAVATELKKPVMRPWDRYRAAARAARAKRERVSPPPVRRLRLRGDWSDTGPDARPERDTTSTFGIGIGQARPQLPTTLMQRMTDVLSRMLNDPMTRAALSAGGEDSLDAEENPQRNVEPSGGGASETQEAAGSMETDSGEDAEARNYAQPQTSSSEPATPLQEASTSGTNRVGNSPVTSTLHNHLAALRNLRQGFINQHGVEPSISFRFSDQSTSSSTISLRANNDSTTTQTTSTTNAEVEGPSSSNSNQRASEMDIDYPEEEEPANSEPAMPKTDYKSINSYDAEMKRKFTGHRNARTMIKEATFWGENYVMSGSDCGHVFIWDRHTAKVQMLLQADQHVVNCLRPHPEFPILATSGIDHDIKLWAPSLPESGFDSELAADLVNRNAIMLEETRDTITVPAAFMIRMLACLNQIRRGARNRSRRFSMDEEN